LLGENGVGEMGSPKQPCQQGERGYVDVRSLPPPALNDPVYVIGHHLILSVGQDAF
jgi:hypothetical protein